MKLRWTIVLPITALLFGCALLGAPEAERTPEPTEVPATPVVTAVPEETPVAVAIETATPAAAPTVPPPPTPEPTPTPEPPLYGITIAIDPGHQAKPDYGMIPLGPDSTEQTYACTAGTRGIASNVYEYQVNLDVAQKLKALLEANGATAILTRTTNDVNLSQSARAAIINESEADLAILLHCNGTDDTSERGAFMMVPEHDCTEHFSENTEAADTILASYCAATGIAVHKLPGITYRRDQACFNWCTRPVICIEMGYLSNETEDLLLTNAAFQDKMAFGISEGILTYFNSGATE
jgi:N-acetylmuramoyl-L-alanine amidase